MPVSAPPHVAPNSKVAEVGEETVNITSGCGSPPGPDDIGADPVALTTALKEHQRHGAATSTLGLTHVSRGYQRFTQRAVMTYSDVL